MLKTHTTTRLLIVQPCVSGKSVFYKQLKVTFLVHMCIHRLLLFGVRSAASKQLFIKKRVHVTQDNELLNLNYRMFLDGADICPVSAFFYDTRYTIRYSIFFNSFCCLRACEYFMYLRELASAYNAHVKFVFMFYFFCFRFYNKNTLFTVCKTRCDSFLKYDDPLDEISYRFNMQFLSSRSTLFNISYLNYEDTSEQLKLLIKSARRSSTLPQYNSLLKKISIFLTNAPVARHLLKKTFVEKIKTDFKLANKIYRRFDVYRFDRFSTRFMRVPSYARFGKTDTPLLRKPKKQRLVVNKLQLINNQRRCAYASITNYTEMLLLLERRVPLCAIYHCLEFVSYFNDLDCDR